MYIYHMFPPRSVPAAGPFRLAPWPLAAGPRRPPQPFSPEMHEALGRLDGGVPGAKMCVRACGRRVSVVDVSVFACACACARGVWRAPLVGVMNRMVRVDEHASGCLKKSAVFLNTTISGVCGRVWAGKGGFPELKKVFSSRYRSTARYSCGTAAPLCRPVRR